MVIASAERHRRDSVRTAELVARTQPKLQALEDRVRAGRLADPARIGRAAQLFDVEIEHGRFLYHYNETAFDYEVLLAGRYVLVTSLTANHAHDHGNLPRVDH